MALIKCSECGCEVSDKAVACPNCGCPIEEIISNLNIKKENNSSDLNQITYKEFSEEKVIEFSSNSVENVGDNTKNLNNKTKMIIICIVVVILFGIIFADVIKNNLRSKNYESMSEQQKVETITQFLGREVDVSNNSISMPQELLDFLKHAKLFKYYGVCTTGYSSEKEYGKVILDIADWISDNAYSDEMFKDIVKQLSDIYGETNIDESASDDLYGEYVWRNTEGYSFIVCGKNFDDKINIRWIIDSNSDNTRSNTLASSEEIKLYTEYEGEFDEKADAYETYATECFLNEFKTAKQSYVKAGGELGANVDSDWYLSASFEYDGNYYFCYNYAYDKGGSRSHILVKYDIKEEQASDATPLEWIEADINAAKAEIDE